MKNTIHLILFFLVISSTSLAQQVGLDWANGYACNASFYIAAIQVDEFGNTYMGGTLVGTADFDPGPDIENYNSPKGEAAFISKLDPDGNLLWVRCYNDADSEISDLFLTSDNQLVATGSYTGTMNVNYTGVANSISSGAGSQCFFLSISKDGNLNWVSSIGGSSTYTRNITEDENHNIYFTGTFYGTQDLNPTFLTTNITSKGDYDVFITKLRSNGSFVWSKTYGGVNRDVAPTIRADKKGNLLLAGRFFETCTFNLGLGGQTATANGKNDAYILKVDTNGAFKWLKTFGGRENDGIFTLAIGHDGNIYVGGEYSNAVDFDPGNGSAVLSNPGLYTNAFFGIYSENGAYIYAGSLNSASYGDVDHISLDQNSGNIYLFGRFGENIDLDPGNGNFNVETDTKGGGFMCILDPQRNVIWGKSLSVPYSPTEISAAFVKNGNIYFGLITGADKIELDFPPKKIELDIVGIYSGVLGKLTKCRDAEKISLKNNKLVYTAPYDELQWLSCDFNYGLARGEKDSIFSPKQNGSFAVEVINEGCYDTTDCYNYTTLSTAQAEFLPMHIYPNPTTGNFTISLPTVTSGTLRVVDSQGKIVYTQELINVATQQVKLDTTPGLYTIIYTSVKHNYTSRILLRD